MSKISLKYLNAGGHHFMLTQRKNNPNLSYPGLWVLFNSGTVETTLQG